jgi:hypothetical protein
VTGPKVLRIEPPHDPAAIRRQAQEQRRTERSTTGIRRTAKGWAAIRSGRLVNEFTGPGCKAAAILEAGTNEVIA